MEKKKKATDGTLSVGNYTVAEMLLHLDLAKASLFYTEPPCDYPFLPLKHPMLILLFQLSPLRPSNNELRKGIVTLNLIIWSSPKRKRPLLGCKHHQLPIALLVLSKK